MALDYDRKAVEAEGVEILGRSGNTGITDGT